jgi:UDP-N-acetylglucosamine--N-acetylmuramyl-(pentapeptide) pyrophosphoryl-undecaprenol N-acetylglucosamine transferase
MTRGKMRVLLTGGGTGGHIYPALAVAKGIKGKYPGSEFFYIGTARGLEADIVPKAGLPFQAITAEGLTRKISWPALRAGLKSIKGSAQAWQIIRRFKPHVVVGTGGYVCGPVVITAALLGIPTLIHEQNAYPGITNKLLARFVDKICITFPESAKYFRTKAELVHTGLPIRPEILQVSREEGARLLNLDPGKFNVLVVGGSQGAQSINRAVVGMYPFVQSRSDLNLLHLTGKNGYGEVCQMVKEQGLDLGITGNITIKPYLYEMENALAAADLVISRAGASFLAEVMAKGLPAILVPYPYAAENHQEYNARALEKNGAAKVILENDFTSQRLLEVMELVLTNPAERLAMAEASRKMGRPGALQHIVECVTALAGI